MECSCAKCDPSYSEEYKKWHDAMDSYIQQNNVGKFDQAILWSHMPIHLLRLPCKKNRKLSKQEQLDDAAKHLKVKHE